jgi:hypothetical protein
VGSGRKKVLLEDSKNRIVIDYLHDDDDDNDDNYSLEYCVRLCVFLRERESSSHKYTKAVYMLNHCKKKTRKKYEIAFFYESYSCYVSVCCKNKC